MKLAVMLVALGSCLSLNIYADPCVAGSLASYEALGSTGCTIGANLVSSFTPLSGTTGGTELAPADITVSTSGGSGTPQLVFTLSSQTQSSLLEALFTYKISGNPLYTQSEIDLSNSSETPDAAVSDAQNICVDGTFAADGVTGCNGSSSLGQATIDSFINSSLTTFTALSFLSVTDDFTIDPGPVPGGSASAGTFTDTFTAGTTVPEPKSTVFFGVLALALAVAAKRR